MTMAFVSDRKHILKVGKLDEGGIPCSLLNDSFVISGGAVLVYKS